MYSTTGSEQLVLRNKERMLTLKIPNDHAAQIDRDYVPVVGTIVEMVLILAVMVMFDFFPDRIGIVRSLTDPFNFRPLLAPELQEHLPWLNLYWGLALGLRALNLTLERWNLYTRCAELGLNALAVYILLRMVLGGPLIIDPGLTMLVKFALAVALILTGIEVIHEVGRLLDRAPTGAQTD